MEAGKARSPRAPHPGQAATPGKKKSRNLRQGTGSKFRRPTISITWRSVGAQERTGLPRNKFVIDQCLRQPRRDPCVPRLCSGFQRQSVPRKLRHPAVKQPPIAGRAHVTPPYRRIRQAPYGHRPPPLTGWDGDHRIETPKGIGNKGGPARRAAQERGPGSPEPPDDRLLQGYGEQASVRVGRSVSGKR